MSPSRLRCARAMLALVAVVAGSAAGGAAPRPGLCDTVLGTDASAPRVAVLSAFPAELAPVVAATDIEATVEVEGRQYHLGRLDGVRVVLGLTRIGLVNATQTTESVVRNFHPAAIVMSAVAGSPHRIADVVVVSTWKEEGRPGIVRVNPAMLELARRGAPALPAPLENCTRVPPTDPAGEIRCLAYEPAVFFERRGQSGDPFRGMAFPCVPGDNEVVGCVLPEAVVEVQDMETAAVARVAARAHVPFVAMRAVSDGAGDPLGDRGFPAQFFDYYRLAAKNASLVTRALLAELVRVAQDPAERAVCRLLARGRSRAAARRLHRQ